MESLPFSSEACYSEKGSKLHRCASELQSLHRFDDSRIERIRICFLMFRICLVVIGCFVFVGCESRDSSIFPPPHFGSLGLSRSGEVQKGKMSWYSVATNGGTKTASGERFSNSQDTAAHRTLPFGTLVEVTNLSNERSAIVRINDRGPFIQGRIIDVSIGVAKKLDFVGHGVVPCRIEVLRSR